MHTYCTHIRVEVNTRKILFLKRRTVDLNVKTDNAVLI